MKFNSSQLAVILGAGILVVISGCGSNTNEKSDSGPSASSVHKAAESPQASTPESTPSDGGVPQSAPTVPRQDVGWIVDGGVAQEIESGRSVHDFEMPTDTTQELKYETLPCVFVSAKTNRVVLRRGPAIYGFFEPTIGEHCYPAHFCTNPDCPTVRLPGGPPLVGVNVREAGTAFCPTCGLDTIESEHGKRRRVLVPYYSPQNKTLEAIMFQQHYRKRSKSTEPAKTPTRSNSTE